MLHPHLAANLGPERFLREIQIAARVVTRQQLDALIGSLGQT
ncbi:MAG: hypothetical protein ACREMR_09825 [Gemmatimonadales bacterium]